ncbi:MAG: hypothetical protein ACE5JM_09190 [Armatimonadota bacterium]
MATALFHDWLTDPRLFVRECLGWKPTPWQDAALVSIALPGTTAIKTGHAVGKTAIAAAAAVWAVVVFPAAAVITTAPTFRQVESLLWREIRSQVSRARIPLGMEIFKTALAHDDEAWAMGLSTDDPNRFQGFHGVGEKTWGDTQARPVVFVIADEAAGIAPAIWQGIKGIITGPSDRLLAIGNPTDPTGDFARMFKPRSQARRQSISSWEAARYAQEHDIPGLAALTWCEERLEEWGEHDPRYQSRVLGEFPAESEFALIPLAHIEAANRRAPKHIDVDPVMLGLDVARFGADRTVWAVRKGDDVIAFHAVQGKDTMHVVGQTLEYSRRYHATTIIIDDVGVGGGVSDRLAELKQPVVPVNFGERARHPQQFVNRRIECWWAVRE